MNIKMLELAELLREECGRTDCPDCPLNTKTGECIIAPDVDGFILPHQWGLHKAIRAEKDREDA